jgi:hypothetical protein
VQVFTRNPFGDHHGNIRKVLPQACDGADGETDEPGHRAVKDLVTHGDYPATLLHLFGLDPAKRSFTLNALPHSLVDGRPARVVHEILA